MTLRPGIFVAGATGVTAPQDARLGLAGLVSGVGVLTGGAVSGSTSGPNMKYIIAAGGFATARAAASDGLFVFANDGALTIDSGAPAPSSGTRWDLVWVRHKNSIEGGGDADSLPLAGVTVGTSGSTPTKPYGSVPTGALVLAESLVGTSIANASLATMSQVAPSSSARGGIPICASSTNYPTSPVEGQHVYDLALHRTQYYNGSAWRPVGGVSALASSVTPDVNGYVTITHGLGFTPSTVHVTLASDNPPAAAGCMSVTAIGATTFKARFWKFAATSASHWVVDTADNSGAISFRWTAFA